MRGNYAIIFWFLLLAIRVKVDQKCPHSLNLPRIVSMWLRLFSCLEYFRNAFILRLLHKQLHFFFFNTLRYFFAILAIRYNFQIWCFILFYKCNVNKLSCFLKQNKKQWQHSDYKLNVEKKVYKLNILKNCHL